MSEQDLARLRASRRQLMQTPATWPWPDPDGKAKRQRDEAWAALDALDRLLTDPERLEGHVEARRILDEHLEGRRPRE